MILTDYFRSKKDITWDLALQCGVTHGVIRLPEDGGFDLTDKSHWQTVYDNFKNYGITPMIVEPMPNEVHDHIKAGDELRDESIEKVLKMMPIMRDFGIETICFNWMAHIGWLRTRSDIPERGGAFVTGYDPADFSGTDKVITEKQLWDNYEYFLKAVIPTAEKYGIKLYFSGHEHDNHFTQRNYGDIFNYDASMTATKHAVVEITTARAKVTVYNSKDGTVYREDIISLSDK